MWQHMHGMYIAYIRCITIHTGCGAVCVWISNFQNIVHSRLTLQPAEAWAEPGGSFSGGLVRTPVILSTCQNGYVQSLAFRSYFIWKLSANNMVLAALKQHVRFNTAYACLDPKAWLGFRPENVWPSWALSLSRLHCMKSWSKCMQVPYRYHMMLVQLYRESDIYIYIYMHVCSIYAYCMHI